MTTRRFDVLETVADDSRGQLILRIGGILDGSNSSDFLMTVLDKLGERPRTKTLILDLAKLEYASSTGIGAFAEIMLKAKQRGVHFKLDNTQESLKRVISLLGFSPFLGLDPD